MKDEIGRKQSVLVDLEGLRKEEVLGKAEEIEGRERRLIRKKWKQEGRREKGS